MAIFQLIREWTTEAGLPAMCIHAAFEPEVKDIIRESRDTVNFPYDAFEELTGAPEPAMEWWCGYVGVREGHPLYGVAANQKCDFLVLPDDEQIGARGILNLVLGERESPGCYFDVHGGITLAAPSEYLPDTLGALPAGVWWFGFDTMHALDHPDRQDEIYVKQECERLATDMATLKVPKGNA